MSLELFVWLVGGFSTALFTNRYFYFMERLMAITMGHAYPLFPTLGEASACSGVKYPVAEWKH